MRTSFIALSVLALLAAGCDPEAPVQSSDVESEIDGKIAVHAADSSTHGNLLVPAANVSGEFDGDQIEDASIGIADLGTGSVGADEIADQSISIDDLGAGSVGVLQLVDDAVTTGKIAPGAVTAADLGVGAVSGGLAGAIADNTVGTADIENLSVSTGDLADLNVTTAKIADMNVTTAKIADMNVTTGKIADMNVTTGKIADLNVTTAKIANLNVSTGKIADQAVTQTKINTNWSGRGTMGVPTTIFSLVNKAGNVTFTLTGSCRSDAAASIVILRNDTDNVDSPGACGDALANPSETFKITVTAMMNDLIEVQYDSAAAGDTTIWDFYSLGF